MKEQRKGAGVFINFHPPHSTAIKCEGVGVRPYIMDVFFKRGHKNMGRRRGAPRKEILVSCIGKSMDKIKKKRKAGAEAL